MDLWTSLKWAASEGAGAGVNRRLVRFLGWNWSWNVRIRLSGTSELVGQFLASATVAVNRFGPAWTRRKIKSQPLGVWLLMLLWTVPSLAFAFTAIAHAIR